MEAVAAWIGEHRTAAWGTVETEEALEMAAKTVVDVAVAEDGKNIDWNEMKKGLHTYPFHSHHLHCRYRDDIDCCGHNSPSHDCCHSYDWKEEGEKELEHDKNLVDTDNKNYFHLSLGDLELEGSWCSPQSPDYAKEDTKKKTTNTSCYINTFTTITQPPNSGENLKKKNTVNHCLIIQ
jgi:hypothetical protein